MTTLEKNIEIPEGFINYRMSGIEKKLDDVVQDIRDIRTHVSNLDMRLSSKMDQLDAKLNSRMDQLDAKLNSRMDKLESRIDKIDDRLWILLIGVTFSILVPILLKFL